MHSGYWRWRGLLRGRLMVVAMPTAGTSLRDWLYAVGRLKGEILFETEAMFPG